MTQPFRPDQDDVLELLAPLQNLDLVADPAVGPGQFRLQAAVGFVGLRPLPVIVVNVFSEATGLTDTAIAALDRRARELQAGFALYVSLGAPPDPLDADPGVPPPDPQDPEQLVVEVEVTNPTGDAFVEQLLEVANLLTIIDPRLGQGQSLTHVLSNVLWARIRVRSGQCKLSAQGDGSDTAGAGEYTKWLRSNRLTVTGLARKNDYTFYASSHV